VLAVHEVQPGDTLFEIATAYDVTVEDILAANSLTEDDVYTIQPGDEVNIPAPTPEGGPTATPAPVPATYTVRAGDTMLAIALRNDVAVDDLLAANGMTINDARSLQPGDEVIIPGAEGAATPTPTSAASATPTQAPTRTPAQTPGATPSPAAVAPENSIRVDAPRLRAPENGTSVSCSGQSSLTWLQVPSVRPSDLYLVHLGYVNSVTNGSEEVIWVISQQRPISTNSWDLDNDLCGLAPNTAGKQWRWYVEVAESTADGLRPVSAASPVWGFTWQ
jgi:LysM repeat protein